MTKQLATERSLPMAPRASSFFSPIQREFDRLFDQLGSGWTGLAGVELGTRMDVRDTDTGLEITIEAPGVDEKDLKISVEDNVLTVSGEKKSETEKKEEAYRISERAYGAFSRSVLLPTGVNADKISATMKNGVLKITAPRDGQAKAKTISIQSGK